jgi:hypothetical protein
MAKPVVVVVEADRGGLGKDDGFARLLLDHFRTKQHSAARLRH